MISRLALRRAPMHGRDCAQCGVALQALTKFVKIFPGDSFAVARLSWSLAQRAIEGPPSCSSIADLRMG